jgi:hypothetical protein
MEIKRLIAIKKMCGVLGRPGLQRGQDRATYVEHLLSNFGWRIGGRFPSGPEIGQSAIGEFDPGLPALPPEHLLRPSWTHFIELIRIDDPLKRAFYEVECLQGNWSIRQLQRQIGSLLYERTGLSTDKESVSGRVSSQDLPPSIRRSCAIHRIRRRCRTAVVRRGRSRIRPDQGWCHYGWLDLIYHRDPDLRAGQKFPLRSASAA